MTSLVFGARDCKGRKLCLATAMILLFFRWLAMQISELRVDRTTHIVIGAKVAKYGNAPATKLEDEKGQRIECHGHRCERLTSFSCQDQRLTRFPNRASYCSIAFRHRIAIILNKTSTARLGRPSITADWRYVGRTRHYLTPCPHLQRSRPTTPHLPLAILK